MDQFPYKSCQRGYQTTRARPMSIPKRERGVYIIFSGQYFGRFFGRILGRLLGRFLANFWVRIENSLDNDQQGARQFRIPKQKNFYDMSRVFFRNHSFIFFLLFKHVILGYRQYSMAQCIYQDRKLLTLVLCLIQLVETSSCAVWANQNSPYTWFLPRPAVWLARKKGTVLKEYN